MALRLHALQHVPFEGLGHIRSWAKSAGAAITATRFHQGQALPEMEAFELLIVMGGPMSTHETKRYPWLTRETQFIRNAIDDGKAVLGICLGAQLIANALEARVYPNEHPEIGWFDIERTEAAARQSIGNCLPSRMKVLHWHGDTFDLPTGALRIARSPACLNQGFVFGDRVVGLQFHLETTPDSLQALIANGSEDLRPGPFVQSAAGMRAEYASYGANHAVLDTILERLAERAVVDP
jgi:GMP synthase (glutamine-hydrolysing)